MWFHARPMCQSEYSLWYIPLHFEEWRLMDLSFYRHSGPQAAVQPGGAARRPLRVTPQSDQQNVGLAAGSRGLRRPASHPPATPSLQPGSCVPSSRRPPHAARGTPGLGIPGQATRALRKWRHSARVAWRRFRKQSRGWLEGK